MVIVEHFEKSELFLSLNKRCFLFTVYKRAETTYMFRQACADAIQSWRFGER